MNLDETLKRAQWETLSDAELTEVIGRINKQEGDLYTLLHILGRAGSAEHRAIMEPYLHYTSDPMICGLALKALHRWWSLSADYRDELIAFLKGAKWDVAGDARLLAVDIAGENLRENADHEILKMLFGIFADETENGIIRSAAYSALARSQGAEWKSLPPASRVTDFATEVDQELMARIKDKVDSVEKD